MFDICRLSNHFEASSYHKQYQASHQLLDLKWFRKYSETTKIWSIKLEEMMP